MSDSIVITFDDQHAALALRAELAKMRKEHLIEMDDVVVVTKDGKGKVELHQVHSLSAAGRLAETFG